MIKGKVKNGSSGIMTVACDHCKVPVQYANVINIEGIEKILCISCTYKEKQKHERMG